MSKPLFFTGRAEILRSDVDIRLLERHGDFSRFQARIDLQRYGLPADALVVIEAYNNAYLERFPLGTWQKLNANDSHVLRNLEPGDRPQFRVKVVPSDETSGRLLAAIDKVAPSTDEDGGGASLLPLVPKSRDQMGDEFWRVHFVFADEPQPELWINRDAQGLMAAIQSQDPKVTSLIMPEILRQVLRGLVDGDIPWTDEGGIGRWLQFAKSFHADEFEPWDGDTEDVSRRKRREWVDTVVSRFAASHRLFALYHEHLQAKVEEIENA